jgi:hypothetical protein
LLLLFTVNVGVISRTASDSIRNDMEEISNLGYPPEATNQSPPQDGITDDQLKGILTQLISSSAKLDVRVWLDGVYTDLENASTHREWMKGREVYFKVEGKVDDLNGFEQVPPRGP